VTMTAHRQSPRRGFDLDISQTAPDDDAALGFERVPDDLDINNEPYGRAPNAETWCQDCGGKYRGRRCPCTGQMLP
jgi:hypothetical protein